MNASRDYIKHILKEAQGHWPYIFHQLNIAVPQGKERTPCPVCGGKDRFRFDDLEGRGTTYCNQCGARDGLNLVCRVTGWTNSEATARIAEILGNPALRNEPPQYGGKPASKEDNLTIFSKNLHSMQERSGITDSPYLAGKGLQGFKYPVNTIDKTTLVILRDSNGTVTAAQTIRPDGKNKRLLKGSAKLGAFHIINHDSVADCEAPQEICISEGLATAASVSLLRPQALSVMGVDAGNLLPVAKVMRERWVNAKIIMAADNDIRNDGTENTGKVKAEEAAQVVNGFVALPPASEKADWNDYHQQHGTEAATLAFEQSIYDPAHVPPFPESEQNNIVSFPDRKEIVQQQPHHNGKRTNLSPSEKAQLLIDHYGKENLAVNDLTDSIYLYTNGIWEETPDKVFKRLLAKKLHDFDMNYSEKGITSAVATMKLGIQPLGTPLDMPSFIDGVYNLNTSTLEKHQRANWITCHNGVFFGKPDKNWCLKTHAPHFTSFLENSAYGDNMKAEAILSALYMVLTNRYDWQYFIEVTGKGGSGKSIFTAVARLLAGDHNTCSCSMEDLNSGRGRSRIVGKRLIIIPDQKRYTGDGNGLKTITGGDPVDIDEKYKNPYTVIIRAVIMITNNIPMVLTERNGGISRRHVIFQFNKVIKQKKRDSKFIEKILHELPVIIDHLLKINPEQARAAIETQRKSKDALEIKQLTDPVTDMCKYFNFHETNDQMWFGGNNTVQGEYRPYQFVYHFYRNFCSYINTHESKMLAPNKLSIAIEESAAAYGKTYISGKYYKESRSNTLRGRVRTNISLNDEAREIIASVAPDDDTFHS